MPQEHSGPRPTGSWFCEPRSTPTRRACRSRSWRRSSRPWPTREPRCCERARSPPPMRSPPRSRRSGTSGSRCWRTPPSRPRRWRSGPWAGRRPWWRLSRPPTALGPWCWRCGRGTARRCRWRTPGPTTRSRTSVRATRGALKPALIGTLIGVTLAGLLLFLAGTNSAPYVVMMPIALFAAVLAGPLVGPIGIQATFTLVVACLFSQVAPPTLELAKDRLVDVLIGACVGVAVGVAAWPRGGQAELRRAGSKCLAAAADCIDTTADWIVATGPPDALGSRLDAVRRALALYESTYAQYRSEPADNRDTTDWLIVGVVTARSANGAEAAAHWADRTGALPWEDVRADLETAARRIADELRSCAYRLTAPTDPASSVSRSTLREADRAAVRAGLAETAHEPGRDEHPDSTLRAI